VTVEPVVWGRTAIVSVSGGPVPSGVPAGCGLQVGGSVLLASAAVVVLGLRRAGPVASLAPSGSRGAGLQLTHKGARAR
jgi:hypothetical protein